MKSHLLKLALFLTVILPGAANAQWIQSITVVPSNPTVNDPIMVLVDCGFPSGTCDNHTQYLNTSGNWINAGALHCLGMATVICNHTDTFLLNTLPAGYYTFYFQLDAGYGFPTCTPGIVPGPADTIGFTVSPAVGLGEFIPQDAVSIYPNPANDSFMVRGLENSDYPVTITVYTTEGKLQVRENITSAEEKINTSRFPNGMYQVHLLLPDGRQLLVPLLKK